MTTPSRQIQSNRISRISTVLMGLVAVFWVVWLFFLLRWLLPFLFQGGFQSHPWVEDGVTVTVGQYIAYGVIWASTIAASCIAFWIALRLLNDLRQGAYFSVKACEKVQRFGLALVATMIADTVLGVFIAPILTWANDPAGPIGNKGLSYFYDPGDITVALCGLGFYGLGWVFQAGFEIERENKEFI